jgi:hypothetical protein
MTGEGARELNRALLSEPGKVERRTRLRAVWTANGVDRRFFDTSRRARGLASRGWIGLPEGGPRCACTVAGRRSPCSVQRQSTSWPAVRCAVEVGRWKRRVTAPAGCRPAV